MDWNLTANIAAVVVPSVTALGFILDQRIKYLILQNNKTLIEDFNGKYIRTKEQLKDNEHFDQRLNSHDERLNAHSERLNNLQVEVYKRSAAGASGQ